MLSLIAAVSEPTYAIGYQGDLPWHIPEDLKHFKRLTKNTNLIMGRNTWESLPKKPLPHRTHFVITRNRRHYIKTENHAHVFWCKDLNHAVRMARFRSANAFIIGGADIYNQALTDDLVDTMYITWVNQVVTGDRFFPRFDKSKWDELFLGQGQHEKWSYRFMHYRRNKDVISLSSQTT